MALVGLGLVFVAARRTLGWALPMLSGVFLLYAYFGPLLDAFDPHTGHGFRLEPLGEHAHERSVLGHDQPVDARLGTEEAVGVLPLDLENGALDVRAVDFALDDGSALAGLGA